MRTRSARKVDHKTNVKNLEEEVEQIFHQEESDDGKMNAKENVRGTPSKLKSDDGSIAKTPRSVLRESTLQTPRRSARKSVKPIQDYEDIVLKSATKSHNVENEESADGEYQQKWNPTEVGRVSQKRGRKTHRATSEVRKSKAKRRNEEAEKDKNENNAEHEDEPSGKDVEVFEEKEEKLRVTAENTENKEKNDLEEIEEVLSSTIEISTQDSNTTERKIEEAPNKARDEQEHFGLYLKTKDADMSDLGLHMIQDDDVFEIEGPEVSSAANVTFDAETKENDGCKDETKVEEETNGKNDTFSATTANDEIDTSDIIIILSDNQGDECEMGTLEISDDEEMECEMKESVNEQPLDKAPKIVLTDEAQLQVTLLATPQPKISTPKRESKNKTYRLPTPYKANDPIESSIEVDERCDEENEIDMENVPSVSDLKITSLEPKDIVLHSIRKRSLSVSVGDESKIAKKPLRNVTFHSPANQTANIEDLDILMIKSSKKEIKKTPKKDINVTQRRKRSMSFDESMMNRANKFSRAYATNTTPSKPRQTPQKAAPALQRTKLPNFSAIHQKQFNKMENVVDHVARKAERAKQLMNSALKNRLPSAKKETSNGNANTIVDKSKVIKKIILDIEAKNPVEPSTVNSKTTNSSDEKESCMKNLPDPRILGIKSALKTAHMKPESRLAVIKPFHTSEQKAKKVIKPTTAQSNDDKLKSKKKIDLMIHEKHIANKTATTNARDHDIENNIKNLPNPKLCPIKPVIKSTKVVHEKEPMHPGSAKKVLKPSHCLEISKPPFNLSTHIAVPSVVPSIQSRTVSDVDISPKGKLATRRQRHMDMFKGRGVNARNAANTSNRNLSHIVRGVRSNRRFELQMQHRMNMENN